MFSSYYFAQFFDTNAFIRTSPSVNIYLVRTFVLGFLCCLVFPSSPPPPKLQLLATPAPRSERSGVIMIRSFLNPRPSYLQSAYRLRRPCYRCVAHEIGCSGRFFHVEDSCRRYHRHSHRRRDVSLCLSADSWSSERISE